MPSSVRFLTVRMFSLLLLLFIHLRACHSSPSIHPQCHDEESHALLQFKQSLAINESASFDPSAYPKVASWKVDGESGDCCSWDGVECDRDSGHVIGLDLSSSFLYGSIDSNSTLFHLVHLRRLNLADNDFNNSEIPSEIRNLPRLFDLNLSMSLFSGQIPAEILELSKLVSIDLGLNSLKLQKPGLQHLVEALTNLEVLHLSGVDISAKVPQIMANLSSLSSLFLSDCGLQGEFPMGIFQLPNLRFLRIRSNPYLTGYLPEFQSGSQLELLMLGGSGTSFSGQLPESIGNLKSLKEFDVAGCYFSGAIPSSLGNLTKLNSLDLSNNSFSGKIPSTFVNLLQLTYLSLSINNFSSGTLHWLCNLTKLNFIGLRLTNLYGEIPSCLGNLTQLAVLKLHKNKLAGQIPSWIGNHTLFISLGLGPNRLHGPIPESIFRLPNLEELDLQKNLFRGTVNVGLLRSRSLVSFQLSGNNLSVIGNINDSIALPKFQILGLGGCNLSGEFPSFLHGQNHLEFVELGGNQIEGHIPKWFMNLGTETLWHLDLSGNFLTGFEQSVDILPWNNLRDLKLSGNKLEGALPIPPRSIISYMVSDNRLTGEIPQAICNLPSLVFLQLSSNNLSSKLPQCLGNISHSASVLDLRNNSFSGDIPDSFSNDCTLRAIDFSQNQFEGKIPRSLANCAELEILNIEKNKINDVFPSWLGIFPKLRVLILRSNRLHGVIGKPRANFEFQRLQIVDLSDNCFRGKLPLEYFRNWTAMKTIYKERPLYMQVVSSFRLTGYIMTVNFNYSMTMTNKGVLTFYEKIQEFLTAIDLSSNRFEGGIPDVLGDLKELYLLNLSNNLLTGRIPPSLSNLKELEALDLSQNKLSGEIPVQLAQLTFLAVFNVSHNVLSGPIPRGNQFDTFDRTSFDANPGLCGKPLSRKCGNGEDSLPSAKRDEGSAAYPLEFGWKVVVTGYASGLVIGVILGCVMDTRKYKWLVKNYFARWQR
ncbi:receptor protein [Salix suchowensis]|nr:receptor protein [Salix suchowensis]